MERKKNLWSGLSYPEEPTPATFLISLDFLASKKHRAHAAVLIQLIKLERATRHQSTVNWALVVSVLTELLLFMVNKPQHGWQSFRAAYKPPHHMAYSTDTTGSTDGLRPEPLQPPIYTLLMSNRAVCRAYIVSVKTEPNLTVYSLHILLGVGSGEEKTDLVPFRASHLLVTVIVLLSLLQHPVQKTERKEFLQWPYPPVWQALLSLHLQVEFIMSVAFAYVLAYATPVTSHSSGSRDCSLTMTAEAQER